MTDKMDEDVIISKTHRLSKSELKAYIRSRIKDLKVEEKLK